MVRVLNEPCAPCKAGKHSLCESKVRQVKGKEPICGGVACPCVCRRESGEAPRRRRRSGWGTTPLSPEGGGVILEQEKSNCCNAAITQTSGGVRLDICSACRKPCTPFRIGVK